MKTQANSKLITSLKAKQMFMVIAGVAIAIICSLVVSIPSNSAQGDSAGSTTGSATVVVTLRVVETTGIVAPSVLSVLK